MRPALRWWSRRVFDLAGYAVGLTLVVVAVLVPPSLLVGAGWNGVKVGLFLAGTVTFGYATLLLWPSRPTVDDPDRSGDGSNAGPSDAAVDGGVGTVEPAGEAARTDTRFEAALGRLPPLQWYGLPPAERFHPGTKLYVASLLMLAVSYAMEALLGVRA